MSGRNAENLTEKCTVCGAPATDHHHYGKKIIIFIKETLKDFFFQEQLRVIAAELFSAEIFTERISVFFRQTPVS